jgi:putative acetyltransferase
MVEIRAENANDRAAIERVHTLAFSRLDEAILVNKLRDIGGLVVSLVAVAGDQIVGHIGFSPVRLETQPRSAKALGLAPLAVLPDFQRKGIGLKLMDAGLQACRRSGAEIVIVLGHPDFYPKAGFKRASLFGIVCEFEVPEEAFMVLELKEGSLAKYQGKVSYHPAFGEVES